MESAVMFVVHDFLPHAVAGTELHVLRLAHTLARSRPVSVFHTLRDPTRPQYALERTEYQGIPVSRLVQNYPYRPLQQTLSDPVIERRFQQELEHFNPGVVHFHHLAFLPLSLPALARRHGAASVFTLHDYYLACPSGGQLTAHPDGRLCTGPDARRCGPCHAAYGNREGRLEALALRLGRLPAVPPDLPFRLYHRLPTGMKALVKRLNPPAPRHTSETDLEAVTQRWHRIEHLFSEIDRFISPSRYLADRFLEWGLPESRLVHLANPGPPLETLPSSTASGRRNGPPGGARPATAPLRHGSPPVPPPIRLLFLGTLAPHKGLARVVDAVSNLPPGTVELEVCGDPDAFPVYTAPIRRRAGALIHFAGPVAPHRVRETLAACDLLVLGSLWPENAPLTVLEAFSAGRPVAAPRLGGIPEQIRDGVDGLLYDSADPDALERSLRRLIDEPGLLEHLTGGVRAPLSVEAHADQVAEIYRQARASRDADG